MPFISRQEISLCASLNSSLKCAAFCHSAITSFRLHHYSFTKETNHLCFFANLAKKHRLFRTIKLPYSQSVNSAISSSAATIFFRPASSSSVKRFSKGLSKSSTPTSFPFLWIGITISALLALSQAICPGN